MGVLSDNDRFGMISAFGTDVELNGRTITAIFSDRYDDEFGISSSIPNLTVRTIDVADDNKGDSLTIDDVAYTIAESPQADGQGFSFIILQKT